jgi:phosphoribosyl-AMP cyclohydrolase
MIKSVVSLYLGILSMLAPSHSDRLLLLTEQSQNRLLIVNVDTKKIVWEWSAQQSNVASEHLKWFNAISDAKPVYNQKYVLLTASGGAVALVRISDKKTMFYANAGNNPHSAEVLPDGNIVSAASTGNVMTVFKVDTLQALHKGYKKSYFLKSGHNVVWDRKRDLLWASSGDTLKAFQYQADCNKPLLTEKTHVKLPRGGAHDLFPIYGRDALWYTDVKSIYQFIPKEDQVKEYPLPNPKDIKSVSSGPKEFPTIIMQPKVKWWSDEVVDIEGNSIYRLKGLKIYKARWFLENAFSYPKKHTLKLCR